MPGAADKVKFGGGVTVRLMDVVCDDTPLAVPAMVTLVGPPVVAELLAVSVNVLVPVVLVGLNEAVTPLGRVDVTARLTLPVNPPLGVTVIVLVLLVPWARLKVLGLAERLKPGAVEVLPDNVSATANEKFVLSVFASAMLCTVRVESSVKVYE